MGNQVWGRTSLKLKTPVVVNPPDQWIRCESAYPRIVSADLFGLAATTVLLLMGTAWIGKAWRLPVVLCALAALVGVGSVHEAREAWFAGQGVPVVYHYVGWAVSMPLQVMALFFLTGTAGKLSAGLFWRLVIVSMLMVFVRGLDAMELGDDTAKSLGTRVELTRLGLMLVAVGFAAFATAAVGPVGFVGFVAGPLARAMLKGAGRGFLHAALVGSLVMLVSDLLAQHLLPSVQLPVGVVTGACGAIFLLWLLITSSQSGRVN